MSEDLKISGPGGIVASVSGLLTPIILVIGLGFGISIYFLNNTTVLAKNQHDMIETQIARMSDGIEVQNWLLSLPQNQRPRLLKPFSANRFIEASRDR